VVRLGVLPEYRSGIVGIDLMGMMAIHHHLQHHADNPTVAPTRNSALSTLIGRAHC
jgi:hypothetical protein